MNQIDFVQADKMMNIVTAQAGEEPTGELRAIGEISFLFGAIEALKGKQFLQEVAPLFKSTVGKKAYEAYMASRQLK